MVKNYDLIWARSHAGWTQAEAADKMGVHRDTFNRWETGARAMPAHKWAAFLKLAVINPGDIPKRVQYDAAGYPIGFNHAAYESKRDECDLLGTGLAAVCDCLDRVDNAEQAALKQIEGDELEARSRERYRLNRVAMALKWEKETYQIFGVCVTDNAGRKVLRLGSSRDMSSVEREMVEYDEERRRFAACKN